MFGVLKKSARCLSHQQADGAGNVDRVAGGVDQRQLVGAFGTGVHLDASVELTVDHCNDVQPPVNARGDQTVVDRSFAMHALRVLGQASPAPENPKVGLIDVVQPAALRVPLIGSLRG